MGNPTSVEQKGNELEKEAPFPLTDVDKWVLSQNDADWHFHNWDELREIVGKQPVTFPSQVQLLVCCLSP